MLTLASTVYDVEIRAAAVPALVLAVLVGMLCLTALGLALAALVPQAKSVDAIALGTLLPLSMVSDVFPIAADSPGAVASVVALLPLKPFQQAVADALGSTTAPDVAWDSLAALAAWGVVGTLAATRLLRTGRTPADGAPLRVTAT